MNRVPLWKKPLGVISKAIEDFAIISETVDPATDVTMSAAPDRECRVSFEQTSS